MPGQEQEKRRRASGARAREAATTSGASSHLLSPSHGSKTSTSPVSGHSVSSQSGPQIHLSPGFQEDHESSNQSSSAMTPAGNSDDAKRCPELMDSLKQGLYFAQQKLNSLERKHSLLKFDVNDVCKDFSMNTARIKVLNSRVNAAYREEEKKWNRCLANAVKRADDFQIKNKELHETIQDLQLQLSLKEGEYKEVVSEREILRKSLRSLQREQMASNDQTNRVRRHSLSIVENMNLAKGLILDVGIFIQEDMKTCIHELNDLVEDFKKEGVNTSMPFVKNMSNIRSEKESDLDISHETQRTNQVCIYITDIKGDMQRFRRTIAASEYVKFMDKEQMELTIDEGAQLVYGGNAFHSESKSLEFVKCILSIKQRYPQQVHLLLGQDDLKLLKNQLVHSDERYFLLHDYLKFAEVGYRFGDTLFLNCTVTPKIAGKVPGHHMNSLGAQEWIKELNSWVKNEISDVFEQHKSVVSRGSIVERLSSFLYTESSTHEMLRIPRSTQIYFVQGGITTLIGVSPVDIHFPWAPDQSMLCGIFAPNLHFGNSRFAIRLEWNGLPTLLGTTPDEKEFAFEIDVERNSIGAGDCPGKQLPDGRFIFASERDSEGQRRFLVTTIPSEEDLLRNQLPKTDTIEPELLNLSSDPRLAEERPAELTDKNTLSEMQQDESNRLPEESTTIPSQEFQKQLKAKNDQIELLARQLEEITLKL